MTLTAHTKVPILDLIAERHSPRDFLDRPIDRELLIALMEAARWAASSRNSQPWQFIIATRDAPEDYARMLACISENNQRWASSAPVLMITVAALHHPDGRPNRFAWHDVGLAVGNLTIQAMSHGLMLRQMGGFDSEKAREVYRIPETHDPVTAIALGYPAALESGFEPLQTVEMSPRIRKPLSDFVFSGSWGESAPLLED